MSFDAQGLLAALGQGFRRPLRLVVVPGLVAIAAMVLSRFVDAPTVLWDTAWTAAAASALAAVLLARRRAAEAHRFRWTMWAAAAASWLAGELIWNLYGSRLPPSPNACDVAWWCFALFILAGVLRSPSRSRSARAMAVMETLPLVAAALALTCALLWPDLNATGLAMAPRVSALLYPAVYVSSAVVVLQALVGGWLRGGSSASSRLVLIGTVMEAVAFSFWSEALLDQTYVQGSSWLDPAWAIGMLAIAAGGVWAALKPEPAAAVSEARSRGGVLPGAVFLLLLAALGKAVLAHSSGVPVIALACGLLFSGTTLMLRGYVLARRLQSLLDRERGTVADMAERESELARINERLIEDSRHDPLTGMRNRRALSYDLPRIESRHLEAKESFAIAVCDVDHFKSYNDQLGHLAGDHALRALSQIIRAQLREEDLGYRFGGEELLLVMPRTRSAEAVTAAERVRGAVEAAALPHPDGIDGILTVSVGVASGSEDAAALLARADAALYAAKRAGRNRVVAASGDESLAVTRERRSVADESVPRQLRSMLTVSRAAAAGLGVAPVLKALAEMIRLELSFATVAVNLRDFELNRLEAVLVLGEEVTRDALLGSVNAWPAVQTLMRPENERCGAYWFPAGSVDLSALEAFDHGPQVQSDDDSLAWQQGDLLLLPVRAASGKILAVVTVDRPLSGRRPDDGDLSVLMAVADHAGLALERVQRESEQDAALREQSAELRLAAVMLLAEALDLRDPGTGRHSRTVGAYARHIATALGLSEDRVERIHAAGVLHDLGKLGIADAVLYKPGPLDEAEWREMKRHPEVGARILEHAGLVDIAAWVRAHHERVDGLGYPDRLDEDQIPLEAKTLAVADAYEAMVAERPYRRAMTDEQARSELVRCAGTQFDPDVVSAFLSAEPAAADPEVDELGILA